MTINWEVIIWTCITLAVLMSVIGLILYAISAKNVRSKRKELGEVHTELKVGSRIMFAGGVYGFRFKPCRCCRRPGSCS